MILTPIVAATPVAGIIAVALDTSGFDPTQLIGTVVTPVIVIALLLFGKLHTDGDYRRVEADLVAERAARVALQTVLLDQVIPAVTRATDAVTRSTDVMDSLARRQVGGV